MADSRLARFGAPIVVVVVFFALWQALVIGLGVKPYVLPDPLSVAAKMADDAPLLWKHGLSTLGTALMGTGLGLLVGVLAALAMHLWPLFRSAGSPFLVLSQNIPIIVLGPLLMIWFGYGLTPKLILLTIVCFFPIALSTLTGLGQSEPHLREYLNMIGASRRERLLRLELPASLPYLFSGLRITVTYVVSSAIVAEWLGGGRGIGYYLVNKFKSFDTAAVFGAIVCIVGLTLLFYGTVVLLERLAIRWRPKKVNWQGGGRA